MTEAAKSIGARCTESGVKYNCILRHENSTPNFGIDEANKIQFLEILLDNFLVNQVIATGCTVEL